MVVIDGRSLTHAGLEGIARDLERVRIDQKRWAQIKAGEDFVKKHRRGHRPIYGINTGFGALAQIRIGQKDLEELQENILLSHHAGVGRPFAPELVRAAMALRLNALTRGHSGVSGTLIRTLASFLNKNIVPVVPMKGSVGASGDLAPMAAIGLALNGKGEVFYRNTRMPARRALVLAGVKPVRLQPKEGIALINGTQFSTAIAGMIACTGSRLCRIADISGAMSLDALRSSTTPFDARIFRLRPHPGAVASARHIRQLLRGSAIIRSHRNCPKVQDPYSLRCMAQVHGAVRDLFSFAERTTLLEFNSVTDNPVIFPRENIVASGGNFHAEPIAFALDLMAMGLAELSSISERRTFRLLDGSTSGLNPFLAYNPGVNSGFMMAQVTAAALVSQNKTLSHPASVDSIPTSANQEDHVSMSMNAGLKALEVLENAKYVLAIETLCACQALDLLTPLKTSPRLEKVKARVRRAAPFLKTDAPLSPLIERVKGLIEQDRMEA
jgi:histidine ammonia-lyase